MFHLRNENERRILGNIYIRIAHTCLYFCFSVRNAPKTLNSANVVSKIQTTYEFDRSLTEGGESASDIRDELLINVS